MSCEPGDAVRSNFVELDGEGRPVATLRPVGEFLRYEAGFAFVRYRTAELPRRYLTAAEFMVVRHETEPEPAG